MPIVLVATLHALAGRTDEIVGAVERLRRASETTPGCESFQAGRGLQDPTEFLVVSTWRDEPSMRAHFRGAGYALYAEEVTPALARPSDVVAHYVERTVHPVGDPSSDPARQG
jgi:quinol monooxygenase YgiN